MRLYHYTSLGHLPHILKSDLSRGEVFIGPRAELNYRGVWLTTDPVASEGHGLSGSTVDKRAVRITIDFDDGDPDLYHWLPWSKGKLGAVPMAMLIANGGGQKCAETWFVYSQPIAPERFAAVEIRREDGTFSAATPEEIAKIRPHRIR